MDVRRKLTLAKEMTVVITPDEGCRVGSETDARLDGFQAQLSLSQRGGEAVP